MLRRGLPHRVPLLAGLLAVVAAGALAVTLEHQSAVEQHQRTLLMVRHVCERTAATLAAQMRDLFGAALFDSIESIHHQQLKAYNLVRVDHFLDAGMRQQPYVTRFFLWHERLPARFAQQVLFYRPRTEPGSREIPILDRGQPRGAFFSDATKGEEIWRIGRSLMQRGRSFGVEERVLAGVRYQLVFHLLWDGARRDRIFGVIGFTVDLDELRRTRFAKVVDGLQAVLDSNGDVVPLALHVTDERGRTVYGVPSSVREPAGSDSVDVLFFPSERLGVYAANVPAVARWQLTVTPRTPVTAGSRSSLALLAAVVSLLLLAVICAMSVNRQAIRLSQLQSDFVANVTHQLRTPLAMLSGAAETLRLERVRSPEKVKEYADIVQAQARRLSVLVDEILHFHRAELADPALVWQPVDLGELIARAADQYRATAAGASVTICVEGHTTGPVVQGDPVALECVIANLLENAVKYGCGVADSVTVSVSSTKSDCVISVRDRGVGISRADLPHIFDKFYRGRTESQSRPGFGLGLAIVRSTVIGHGGRITVQSEPGHGSEFTVWLPLAV